MTRQIKFRAWDTKANSMVDITEDEYQLYVMAQGNIVVRQQDFSASSSRFVLMQFTGLLDKNGKEIYEGDILDNAGTSSLAIVSFQKGMFVVGDYLCELYKFSGDTKEIIGNIYENPELLK